MNISQNLRGEPSIERPTGLYDDVLNIGRFLVNNTPPISTSGHEGDYFIDSSSGNLYGKKTDGNWGPPIYNFVTGGGSGELTNLSNIGEGVQIFKPPLNGTVAELRTLTSDANGVVISTDTPIVGSLDFSMSPAYKPVLLSGIRDNGVLAVSLGGDTLDPNGLLGLPEYPRGSLYVQVGLTDTLWICNDDVGKVWLKVSGEGAGISSITNVGAGVGLFRDLTGPSAAGENANFKSITGTSGKTDVVDEGSFIRTDMNPSYVPESLDLVTNIKDNRYAPLSQPTIDADSTLGYSRGSIWIEQELGGLNKVWICDSPAVGAAVWQLYPPAGTGGASKDFVQYTIGNTISYTQAITGSYQDFNFGPDAPTVEAIALASNWSTLYDGVRQVFRRSNTTAGRNYMCSVTIIIQSFAPTGTENDYTLIMTRKEGGLLYTQSLTNAAFPASSVTTKTRTLTNTFIFSEPLSTQQDYYFRIRGTQVGGGAGINFNVETWAVSFKEI